MLEIHIYGSFKTLFVPKASLAEDTIVSRDFLPNEVFSQLLDRLNISMEVCGDCFINGRLAKQTDIIPKGARIGIFPKGMNLIDGGLYLKI
ncbi:hypothetical protein [Candidatus Hodarchaeum mangrovi]